MKKYHPNTSDPRVVRRIKKAYGYALGVFDSSTPTACSQAAINKRFGKHSNPLSKYLRKQLLTCVDHHFSEAAGVSKKYILNAEGVDRIRAVLQDKAELAFTTDELPRIQPYMGSKKMFDEHVVIECAKREFRDELESLEFTYEDKSGRLWHQLQNLKKDFKKHVLADSKLRHVYDIRACAPTLLLQHSQQLGNDEYLFSINSYLKNKEEVREHIASEVEINTKTAKLCINALFCGARLGLNNQFALTAVLHSDPARVIYMKQLTEELRADIKTMWSYITPSMPRRSITDCNGHKRKLAVTSKQKWCVYFELERRVLDAVHAYLKETGNKCFLEHDGWATEKMIDEPELIAYVKRKTGFLIALDYENVGDIKTSCAAHSPKNESLSVLASSPRPAASFLPASHCDGLYFTPALVSFPHVAYISNCDVFSRQSARSSGEKCHRPP